VEARFGLNATVDFPNCGSTGRYQRAIQNKEAFKDGAIDVLHKQLMAVAVALTTQCPYCLELHVKAARQAGANDAMLTEAAIVIAAMRAGAAVTHASHLFKE
jgi:AhpD family alkylhydroperoxidase